MARIYHVEAAPSKVVVKKEHDEGPTAPPTSSTASNASWDSRETSDLKRLYGRLQTAIARAPPDVRVQYDSIWNSGIAGKNQIKREFLEEWLTSVKDGAEFTSGWFKRKVITSHENTDGTTGNWMTLGRLKVHLGDDAETA